MLSQFLVSEIFAFLLVFCRLGSALMLMPGFGETYVAMRIRLMLALMFSLALAPIVEMPPVPETAFAFIGLVGAEVLIGLFLGALTRMLIGAVHMGGMIIAYQSSLISALVPDITQGQTQGTALGNFLGVAVVTLLFATNLHHLMLKSLADSYSLFLPGQYPPIDDFVTLSTQTMSGAFRMAMQLAAPHIVIGLIIYLASGIIARLIPNIQVFFVLIAPQILLSFFVLMIVFSTLMMWYMDYFKDTLGGFLAP